MLYYLRTVTVLCFWVLVLWVAGFIFFLYTAATNRNTINAKADAIIALTGGSLRVEEAIRLLRNGAAGRLFISGTQKDVKVTEILAMQPSLSAHDTARLLPLVELGKEATTTAGNGIETCEWVQQNQLTRIILVTAHYHLPRSILEIKRNCSDLVIIPHTVSPYPVNFRTLTGDTDKLTFLINEYNKYLLVKAQSYYRTIAYL